MTCAFQSIHPITENNVTIDAGSCLRGKKFPNSTAFKRFRLRRRDEERRRVLLNYLKQQSREIVAAFRFTDYSVQTSKKPTRVCRTVWHPHEQNFSKTKIVSSLVSADRESSYMCVRVFSRRIFFGHGITGFWPNSSSSSGGGDPGVH